MFQFVAEFDRLKVIADLVDVDSAKWKEYAEGAKEPLAWAYRREGERLLAYERSVTKRADISFFVTDAETELFRKLAPDAGRIATVENGVDTNYFDPHNSCSNPYPAGDLPIVFTGAMDYKPNVDGVVWFVRHVLPGVRQRCPSARFYVVGARPVSAVKGLEGSMVTVTGGVPDVRPFLLHAAVVVAPLLIARGLQNKVLEAMAMSRAVVASRDAAIGINATSGLDFEVASGAAEFTEKVVALLTDAARSSKMGTSARRVVLDRYDWATNLSKIDAHLQFSDAARSPVHDTVERTGNPDADQPISRPTQRSTACPTST
jgi:sugar transferase (PEP-CTERM/EpsH1 system associated)